LSTRIELYKSPRAQPTIIPGKKRPLGTATPYVVIVQKYHKAPITTSYVLVRSGSSSTKCLINPPSVFQRIVAIGL